jgi:hypothetical protein
MAAMMNIVIWLMFTTITGSMAFVSMDVVREQVTQEEMDLIVNYIHIHEIKTGSVPASLSTLAKYFKGTKYLKDSWNNDYTYDSGTRELCSINDYWGVSPNNKYCVSF